MANKIFFAISIDDRIFGDLTISRMDEVTLDDIKGYIQQGVHSCLDSSHSEIMQVLHEKLGIRVEIPEVPILRVLERGDFLILMFSHGFIKNTETGVYTPEEMSPPSFSFHIYVAR